MITIFYRAYGWRSNGVRWQGPASCLTYSINPERWYSLNENERHKLLEQITKMSFPEVNRIDRIAIEGTK